MNNDIVFSHGFGVDKTARGMFSDICEALPEYRFHLFDYNRPTENGLELASFGQQARILQARIDEALSGKEPDAQVDLVCHSQGAIAATMLASFVRVRRAVFIVPPRILSEERMKAMFGSREWVEYYPNGLLKNVPRRDGTTTTITEEYWKDFHATDLSALYIKFLREVPTTVIFAASDEVLWSYDDQPFSPLIAAEISIAGNHDFTGEYRTGLIKALGDILTKDA